MSAPTYYFSEVIADSGVPASVLATRFAEYVAANYKLGKRPATCAPYRTEAAARAAMKQQSGNLGSKAIETGWIFNGAASPSQPAPPKGKTKEDGLAAPGSADRSIFCWTITSDYTVYMSKSVDVQATSLPSRPSDQFDAFTAKTYGAPAGARCFVSTPSQAGPGRQAKIDQIRKGSPRAKFVDFDWTPTAEVAAPSKAVAPIPPAPSAPAAAKPATTAPPVTAKAQSAPRQAAPPQSAQRYTYCSASGAPFKGPGQQHFYVTKPFPVAAGQRADSAFGVYITSAHRQESIIRPMCMLPSALEIVESQRHGVIEGKQRDSRFAIAELDWRMGQ